ncbi:MAG: hypothetical protein PUD15_01015 [Prevotella sp.]|nr:hypothetical protein [Prevotella sp.]
MNSAEHADANGQRRIDNGQWRQSVKVRIIRCDDSQGLALFEDRVAARDMTNPRRTAR